MGLFTPKCPSCAAPLEFRHHATSTTCGYCGSQVTRKHTILPQFGHLNVVPVDSKQGPPVQYKASESASVSPVRVAIVLVPLMIGLSAVGWLMMVSRTGENAGPESRAVEPSPEVSSAAPLEAPPEAPPTSIPVDTQMTSKAAADATEKRAVQRRKTHKAKKLATPEGSNAGVEEEAPELSSSVAKRVLRRVHMLHCGDEGNVSADIVIAPSGAVASVSPEPLDEVGRCVADTIEALRFPASSKGLTLRHRYQW